MRSEQLSRQDVERVVRAALAEDLPWGDLTTDTVIDPAWPARATVLYKEAGVVAGLPLMEAAFRQMDPALRWEVVHPDGAQVAAGTVVACAAGSAAALLRAERVALNFVQRLSGIATLTARTVAAVEGLPTRITDTRKTTPGLRALEKYAVRVGGGHNHRFALSDGVMLKDNHLALLAARGISLEEALRQLRARAPHGTRLEVEVETLEQVDEALRAGADILLLDNMDPPLLREAVALVAGRAHTEASGGITLDTVRSVAESGVDTISVGALTHSAPALDVSLEMSG